MSYDRHVTDRLGSNDSPLHIGLEVRTLCFNTCDTTIQQCHRLGGTRSLRVAGCTFLRVFFAGPIPPELGQLYNLEELSLTRNNLSGEIRVAP